MTTTIAFVTGADRGLGQALVERLEQRGHVVYAAFHGPLPAPRPSMIPLPLDVADLSSVDACARRLKEEVGRVDLVINNAAILGPVDRGGVGELDYQQMIDTFDVNALGPLRVSQTFWPLLVAGTQKLIVNISSEAGSIAQCWRDGWFGYGMSKAALNMGSAQFHNAIRPYGGRVLVLHPGWVKTWMRGSLDDEAELTPDQSAMALLDLIERRGHEAHDRPLYLQWDGKELPW